MSETRLTDRERRMLELAVEIQCTARAAHANWRSEPGRPDYWMDRMDQIIERLGIEGRALHAAWTGPQPESANHGNGTPDTGGATSPSPTATAADSAAPAQCRMREWVPNGGAWQTSQCVRAKGHKGPCDIPAALPSSPPAQDET